MEIVLLILKIIGIILLSLLGFILLALALVIFYPVSYNIRASYDEELCAKVKVHWLFHLISVTLNYGEAGKKCILRIFGIPIADFLNPKPKKEKKNKEKKKAAKKKKKEKPLKGKKSGKDVESGRIDKSESAALDHDLEEYVSGQKEDSPPYNAGEEAAYEKEGASLEDAEKISGWRRIFIIIREKITGFFSKMKKLIQSIVQKISGIYHKGMRIKEKAQKWIDVLTRERTKLAINKAKVQICGLLKHVMPRKWNAYLQFGFEDPKTTGQLYGYYWMFIGVWNEHFICVPDFENKVLKGTVWAKGHVQAMKLLYVAFKFMFDKDLVYLRKLNMEVNS